MHCIVGFLGNSHHHGELRNVILVWFGLVRKMVKKQIAINKVTEVKARSNLYISFTTVADPKTDHNFAFSFQLLLLKTNLGVVSFFPLNSFSMVSLFRFNPFSIVVSSANVIIAIYFSHFPFNHFPPTSQPGIIINFLKIASYQQPTDQAFSFSSLFDFVKITSYPKPTNQAFSLFDFVKITSYQKPTDQAFSFLSLFDFVKNTFYQKPTNQAFSLFDFVKNTFYQKPTDQAFSIFDFVKITSYQQLNHLASPSRTQRTRGAIWSISIYNCLPATQSFRIFFCFLFLF